MLKVNNSPVRSALLIAASIFFLLTPVVKIPISGGSALHLDSLSYLYAMYLFLKNSFGAQKLKIPRFAVIAVYICFAITVYTFSVGTVSYTHLTLPTN